MEKISRKIFQPNRLTNLLLDGTCGKDKANLSEFINTAIEEYYTPLNAQLKNETDLIFMQLQTSEQDNLSPKELKTTLARCVEILKDYPIKDVTPLRQIFNHFVTRMGLSLRYDYINIVNHRQNEILHRLNDILKTVDSDFNLGMREFGERNRYVFAHWTELYQYSEIYIALATIIECEDVYYPLDLITVITLIKELDLAITESVGITPIKKPFVTNISDTDKYYGIQYEILMYYTNNGYSVLSGDDHFRNIPQEIRAYFQKIMNIDTILEPITDKNVKEIAALESEGRFLFERLAQANIKEKNA